MRKEDTKLEETFFMEKWWGVFFGIVSFVLTGALAGLWAFCRSQLKEYKNLLTAKKNDELEELIDKKLEDVTKDIEDLRNYIREVGALEQSHMNLIISSYRYRLVQLCKLYLKQQYMTQEQYDQLTEFYKVYSGLGGNGQAHEYYEKAIKLDIRDK